MQIRNNRVLFYGTSLEDIKAQKFYQIDFDIIKENGYELIVTDHFSDLFKWWKYDILFIYFYTHGAFRALAARFLGKSVYFTGGIDALDKATTNRKEYYQQKIFFKICYWLATKCIIVSDNDYNNIDKIYKGKLKEKLSLSYHVIDIDKFYDENRNRDKLFVSICWQGSESNVRRKGVDKSLQLFKYLLTKDEYKEYKYLIVGRPGAGTPYLKKLIDDLSLSKRVELLGEVDEDFKIKLLKRAKYYFQLSTYEGFGLAALEAIASGDIVIHSGAGGLKYVVADDGVLVNATNIESNCESIYVAMNAFDIEKLASAQRRIRFDYSYEVRKNQFAQIFCPQRKYDATKE